MLSTLVIVCIGVHLLCILPAATTITCMHKITEVCILLLCCSYCSGALRHELIILHNIDKITEVYYCPFLSSKVAFFHNVSMVSEKIFKCRREQYPPAFESCA